MTRPFRVVRQMDQWLRCSYSDVAYDPARDLIELSFQHDARDATDAGDGDPANAGAAFDLACRVYHARPDLGQIERTTFDAKVGRGRDDAVIVLAVVDDGARGEFESVEPPRAPLDDPGALAIDVGGRLFVAERGARRVHVLDLANRRLLRTIDVDGVPLDLSTLGQDVWVVTSAGLLGRMGARSEPRWWTLPATVAGAARVVALSASRMLLVTDVGTADAKWVEVELAGGARVVGERSVPFASDVEVLFAGGVEERVVARRPGEDFLRFVRAAADAPWAAAVALHAHGYDGRGTVVTPTGRVGYFVADGATVGLRLAVVARRRYRRRGRVTTFRLDAGRYRETWGRVLIDACVPAGTSVRVVSVATDDPPDDPEIARIPPANVDAVEPLHPEATPLPPAALAVADGDVVEGAFFRRSVGREVAWTRAGEEFETFEAALPAATGRYLWLTLELVGDGRKSPRVKQVRVEVPGHDLLRRLPRIFSEGLAGSAGSAPGLGDGGVADFLRRFLAMFDATLADLDARSTWRHLLLDARSAPDEVLPWLAEFQGLVLDERWSPEARRTLTRDVAWFFRTRGTLPGLKRMLEVVLDGPVVLIEHYRLRGLGGAFLGTGDAPSSTAVLGYGFRVGGAVGEAGEVTVGGKKAADAFATHAHRFTVVVPGRLDGERRRMIVDLLDAHRPAHTVVDAICTVDAGMRVGMALYVELTSVAGATSGFVPLRLDGAVLGRDAVLGLPAPGFSLGDDRLGVETRIW